DPTSRVNAAAPRKQDFTVTSSTSSILQDTGSVKTLSAGQGSFSARSKGCTAERKPLTTATELQTRVACWRSQLDGCPGLLSARVRGKPLRHAALATQRIRRLERTHGPSHIRWPRMRSAVRRSVRLLRPSSTAIGALIALALACVLVGVRYTPPAALPADADPAAFSAGRARAALQRVLSGRPHPTGSHENRRVRERIEAELGALDFAVEVQRATVCGSFGSCAAVENVLALHPGQRSDLLLLSV